MEREPKIMVAGIGGVGGYLAAMLAKTYRHVTFVARGARKEKLKREGLTLHSELNGEIHVHPWKVQDGDEDFLEVQDYLLICVKNYSLQEICAQLKGAIDEHTVVIPVMNGVDCAERAGAYLDQDRIAKALIYIVSYIQEDGNILHEGAFADLRIGVEGNGKPNWLLETEKMMQKAGISCRIGADVEAEIWKKYILNCAYNVMTALYDKSIGELRKNEKTRNEYLAILKEAYAVACKMGVHIEESYVDDQYNNFLNRLKANATSSLQRDLAAGKKSELDTFSGYLVREAKRQGIPIPVSEACYQKLLKKERGE